MASSDEMKEQYSKRLINVEEALSRVFPAHTDLIWARAVTGQSDLPLQPESLDKINAPGWELLRRGGKRWRPLVMILSHELHGGAFPGIDELTALVELPHNGSLIVDDIEDKAVERRGGPAIHLVHGVDMAINTGNFLYFEPTYLIEQSELEEIVQYRMTKFYLRVMRRLHFGQGLDILWHNDHEYLPNHEEYLQMCRFKTGALSRLAAELGAVVAGATEVEIEAAGSLWEDIGVGFQILDDVKNLATGNPGKMRGDDIIEGKKSLPCLIHAQRSDDGGRSLLQLFSQVTAAGIAGSPVKPLIERAIAMMEASGALDEAYRVGEALLEGALDRLKTQWGPSPERSGMESLIESFWHGLKK